MKVVSSDIKKSRVESGGDNRSWYDLTMSLIINHSYYIFPISRKKIIYQTQRNDSLLTTSPLKSHPLHLHKQSRIWTANSKHCDHITPSLLIENIKKDLHSDTQKGQNALITPYRPQKHRSRPWLVVFGQYNPSSGSCLFLYSTLMHGRMGGAGWRKVISFSSACRHTETPGEGGEWRERERERVCVCMCVCGWGEAVSVCELWYTRAEMARRR